MLLEEWYAVAVKIDARYVSPFVPLVVLCDECSFCLCYCAVDSVTVFIVTVSWASRGRFVASWCAHGGLSDVGPCAAGVGACSAVIVSTL